MPFKNPVVPGIGEIYRSWFHRKAFIVDSIFSKSIFDEKETEIIGTERRRCIG